MCSLCSLLFILFRKLWKIQVEKNDLLKDFSKLIDNRLNYEDFMCEVEKIPQFGTAGVRVTRIGMKYSILRIEFCCLFKLK